MDNFKICMSCQLYNHWHLPDGHCENATCECEYRREPEETKFVSGNNIVDELVEKYGKDED